MTSYRYASKPHLNVRFIKNCIICGVEYLGTKVQKTCSKTCRRKKDDAHQKTFRIKNPDAMKGYNENRLIKNPLSWAEAKKKERLKIITALGSKCSVENCNVSKVVWLHIDYAPTMIGTGLRHPRHAGWVLDHIKDFRLLCANHHYELTITGKIEGSSISQQKRIFKKQLDKLA